MASKSTAKGKMSKREARLLERMNLNAAGIDVGASQHWVAVPDDRDDQSVQSFGSHTGELNRLADWLVTCGIETVAMESTGVYWIPLYDLLEERGLTVILANAHQVKNVPGRKTDVLDCQWLQELHTFGLLRGSFRPTSEITALRTLVRHRETLIKEAAAFVQRMQKVLVLMNVQLPTVISDITGKTGMTIIRRIVAGETSPAVLASFRDERCHATLEQIEAALTGHYRSENVFLLGQALACYDFLQSQVAELDTEIERRIKALEAQHDHPAQPLPPERSRHKRGNEPKFEIRSPLYRLTDGVDLTQVPGIGPLGALKLIAEIGTDMSKWPTAKHFAAWLTLSPQNKITGGKRLSSKTQPSASRAAQILRVAAMANSRSQNALAACFRRLALRIGTPKATTAIARKLAVIIYNMLKNGTPYREQGAETYNAQQRQRRLRHLTKQAQALGFTLVPDASNLPATMAVS